MKFSWGSLPKPFFALAPMEGATDTVFRQIVNSCARPDVSFTEFTNTDGLLSKGRDEVGKRLIFDISEKPLIAQIWGKNPESFYKSARLISTMGFDGIDINMGCPEKTVVNNGCCSALIENPNLATEIIKATKEGAPELPISVKTRIGFKTIKTYEWIKFLLEQNIDALTVHFRTQKEMSLVPAHWEEAEIISNIKSQISNNTIIIGNGDVISKKQGYDLALKYGLDGVMIGRGVFQNPYVFDEKIDYNKQNVDERIELLKNHISLFEKTWKITNPISEKNYAKSFPPLKRFFKIYISGFDGASEMREKLMATNSVDEVKEVIDSLAY